MSEEEIINVGNINFHTLLKDMDMFWFFLLSIRTLSDVDVQNILRTKNSTNEGYEGFNQMLDKFNKATNLKITRNGNVTTSNLNIRNEMNFIGRAMVIFICELLSSSDYKEKIEKSSEFQFLKHVRNGAAHNNRFNFKYQYGSKKGEWIIKKDEKIRWGKKELTRDLQNQEVFGNFVSVFDIFLLARYFSDRLSEMDSNKDS